MHSIERGRKRESEETACVCVYVGVRHKHYRFKAFVKSELIFGGVCSSYFRLELGKSNKIPGNVEQYQNYYTYRSSHSQPSMWMTCAQLLLSKKKNKFLTENWFAEHIHTHTRTHTKKENLLQQGMRFHIQICRIT